MDLYEILKERSERRSETLAVFHSLNLLKFHEKHSKKEMFSEKDFIIVSAVFGYILIIEAKKTLNPTTLEKSLKQLKDTREKIMQYLQTDILMNHKNLKREWVVIPMIYCEAQHNIRIGDDCICDFHIITGENLELYYI